MAGLAGPALSDLNYLLGEKLTADQLRDQNEKRYQNFSNIAKIVNHRKRERLQPGSVKLQLLKKRAIREDPAVAEETLKIEDEKMDDHEKSLENVGK